MLQSGTSGRCALRACRRDGSGWRLVVVALALVAGAQLSAAKVATLTAVRDTTLIERDPNAPASFGYNSNGAGPGLFIGRVSTGTVRRTLLAFEVAREIPAGSTIKLASLTLSLNLGKNLGTDRQVTVYKLTADFGEGTSNWFGGQGAAATENDATWVARIYPHVNWTNPGGDFLTPAVAQATLTVVGAYTFTGLADTVQSWIDSPLQDHGLIVLGDESCTTYLNCAPTAMRFYSREGAAAQQSAGLAPRLTVEYDPPAASSAYAACCLSTGSCALVDPAYCLSIGGVPDPEGSQSCANAQCTAECDAGETCVMGACCYSSGLCGQVTEARCQDLSGTYLGNNAQCGTDSCRLNLQLYVDELPIPQIAEPYEGRAGAAAKYTITMQESKVKLHRDLPPTTMWTYNGMFPGPVIEAWRDQPVHVTWVNDLRDTSVAGQPLRTDHYLPVETCIHGPNFNGPIPFTMPHLHGGIIPMRWDGHPDFAFQPGENQTFYYPNPQRAAALWYHDHGLGITRLNVYMGLAGMYIIRDEAETKLKLPSGKYEVPLVITDRDFNTDGSLKFLSKWGAMFTGKYYVVNGKISPYLRVEQRGYRFRILNACNSRVLGLRMSSGKFYIIGSDQGLIKKRKKSATIYLAPAERLDVVVDFSKMTGGDRIKLFNRAPAHLGQGSNEVKPGDQIMQFHVVDSPKAKGKPKKILDKGIEVLKPRNKYPQRVMQLYEMPDSCGGKKLTVNGLGWDTITEFPREGAREVWMFANIDNGHVHPMHVHLAHFQVIERQSLNRTESGFTLLGSPSKPAIYEQGWKDTVLVGPLTAVTVVVSYPEGYVGRFPYHCHALEHEDHDMMRQVWVTRTNCNDNGVCESDEDCFSCPADCGGPRSGARCGNGLCEAMDGENCGTCPDDCAGSVAGTCCGMGEVIVNNTVVGTTEVGCGANVCKTSGRRCREMAVVKSCCGDTVCTGVEDADSCALDCGA